MDDFKVQLKAAYDKDAQRRVEVEENRDDWKLRFREEFCDILRSENRQTILELGAGIGSDSIFFQYNGFKVLATDLSDEMVARCREKGLNAQVIDLYSLDRLETKFDGIYSMNVLLHVPRHDLEQVLETISRALNPGGVFFYGVYGGSDEEKVIVDHSKMGMPRLFSFLSDDTIQTVADKWFSKLKFEVVDIGSNQPNFHFQALMLRKIS